jgi:hypothetical protein
MAADQIEFVFENQWLPSRAKKRGMPHESSTRGAAPLRIGTASFIRLNLVPQLAHLKFSGILLTPENQNLTRN